MPQVIPASQITLDQVKTRFNLTFIKDPDFFPESRITALSLPETT